MSPKPEDDGEPEEETCGLRSRRGWVGMLGVWGFGVWFGLAVIFLEIICKSYIFERSRN